MFLKCDCRNILSQLLVSSQPEGVDRRQALWIVFQQIWLMKRTGRHTRGDHEGCGHTTFISKFLCLQMTCSHSAYRTFVAGDTRRITFGSLNIQHQTSDVVHFVRRRKSSGGLGLTV